jgi:hypothetical protein
VSRGLSLHIGLNRVNAAHYAGWDGPLDGCEFDAHDMEQLAQSRGFEKTTKLLTSEATAGAVIAAIDEAARELNPGDIFFLSYAGHGGQVPDLNDEDQTALTRPGLPTIAKSSMTNCTSIGGGFALACASSSCLIAATAAPSRGG